MQAEESLSAAMAARLSRKAELLLAVLIQRGGGIVDEYLLRDGTGLSHGSIVAARRELVAGGWLRLGKQNRKLVYSLTGQGGAEPPVPAVPAPIGSLSADSLAGVGAEAAAGTPMEDETAVRGSRLQPLSTAASTGEATIPVGPVPASCPEPEDEDNAFARLIEPMAHVTGCFASLDEWTDALIDTLGGNIDITESLVEDGVYQIHSYDHQGDDSYQVTKTADGITVE